MVGLFDGVLFHFSSSLAVERSAELKGVLLQSGAKQAKSIHLATHIITDTNNFEGCQDVGAQVSVVTDMWVERSLILEKLQAPSHYSADPAMIFSGVVACATELPSADVEVLSAGITALGGQWRTALTRDVTHLFCVSNSSPKYETAMYFKEQTSVHVLLPHWFDDSVRLGAPIPVEPYEWPDPICIRPSTTSQQDGIKDRERPQHKLTTQRKARLKYGGCMADDENMPKGQSSNIWGGRRIVLSTTLDIAPSRRSAIESGIARCGGIIVPYLTNHGEGTRQEETENVSNCDILVTKWRSGRAYVRAVRENKTIGTLGWVFCVHATGTVSRPMDQLLHYPILRRPIENFSNHEITVTNYTGEAREYLKKLITTMGASFTPSMTGKNTVLIAAYLSGTKTTKAAAWSIPIVNHTWIEDCFIKWRNLTVGLEKYIYFPPGVDFSKFLGERGVGRGIASAVADADNDENNVGGWVALECEEDLDALEMEEDFFEAKMAEMDDEGSVGGEVDRPLVIGQSSSPFRKRGVNGTGQEVLPMNLDMLLSPATASADAREVEAAMDPGDDENIDVSKGEEPAKSTTPVQKKRVEGEGSKKYVLHAIEITKPPSSRQSKVRAIQDQEDDDIERTSERRSSRLGRGKTEEPSPKDVAMKRGKGKTIDLEQSEESNGDRSRSRGRVGRPAERPASKGAGSARDCSPKKGKAKQVNATLDGKNNVSKLKIGRAENHDDSDETEEDEDEDLAAQKSSTRTKKAAGKVGKTKAIMREESEDEDVSAKRSPNRSKSIKTETRKTPNPQTKSEVDVKGRWKQTVQEDEDESEDISFTRSGKTRRKSVAVEEDGEAGTSRRKSVGPPKPVNDSSPLSPPLESSAIRTSKRSAALKASQRLHDEIMPDMNTYQRALKKGRISLGAAQEELLRATERVRRTPGITSRKRKGTESSDEEEEELEIKKKRRVSFDYSTIEPRKMDDDARVKVERSIVLLTTQVNLADDVEKALVKLGVKLTAKATECTHLIAPRIVRTEKFLAAISGGPFILSEEWAKRSAAKKKLLPENDYALHDKSGEEKFSFKLKDAIVRAKRGKVFAGKTFYVTPKVQADMQLLKNVIISCGAQCYTTTPTVRMLDANANRHVISCPEDISIWRPIAAHHPIYNQELVLTSALRQLAEWDNYTFRVPGSF